MTDPGKLTLAVPTDREIVLARAFEAPRGLVFEAFTRPALLERWLRGPPRSCLVVCDVDLRVGGAYRFVWRLPDGGDMGVGGVYREVARPERTVHTERFDRPAYPGEALVTLSLAESGGRTTARTTIRYESRQARDLALRSGKQVAFAADFPRLDEVLAADAAPLA